MVNERSDMGRIHLLGVGSIGTLVAHHLRLANPALPLSLIVRKPELFSTHLSVTRDGTTATSTGFEYEVPSSKGGHIASLVVALKTNQTLPAIRPLLPRLGPSSVITLIQNGMGVADQLSDLWPDKKESPSFILGTTPHGVAPTSGVDKGAVEHHTPSGQGDIKFGVLTCLREDEVNAQLFPSGPSVLKSPLNISAMSKSDPQMSNLFFTINALLSMTPITPVFLPYDKLKEALLLKLAVNAVANPLTAILGRGLLSNGTLTELPGGPALVDSVVDETSRVLLVYLESQPGIGAEVIRQFQYPSLRKHVANVLVATCKNTSSMAVDVREKRSTEIDYITGYVIRLGKEMGVPTPVNETLYNMIRFIESSSQ